MIAALACAANFVTFGTLFSFGVFLTPLADSFGTTTGPISPLFSGAVAIYYVAGAMGGRLGDRHGVRWVVITGAVALPAGLAAASVAPELWVLYLCYVPLVGIGVGCCYTPLIGVVGQWFERRRSHAIGLLLAGVGGGTLVVPIAARALIDAAGWRWTLAAQALLAVVVVGAAAVVVRNPPGRSAPPATATTLIRGSSSFRWLYASAILLGPGFFAPFAFYNDYAVDQGVSAGLAAALVGVVGASSVVGRLAFGSTGGLADPMRQYQLGFVLMTASLLCWLAAGGSYVALVASALLLGIGWAAWVTAAPLVFADWFGVEALGGVLGAFYTGLGVGALGGPAVSGFVIDQLGYRWAIAFVAGAAVLATVLTFLPSRYLLDERSGRLISRA